MAENCPFSKLKPVEGEDKYVYFDEAFSYHVIIGDSSGFCYGMFESEQEAEAALPKELYA